MMGHFFKKMASQVLKSFFKQYAGAFMNIKTGFAH